MSLKSEFRLGAKLQEPKTKLIHLIIKILCKKPVHKSKGNCQTFFSFQTVSNAQNYYTDLFVANATHFEACRFLGQSPKPCPNREGLQEQRITPSKATELCTAASRRDRQRRAGVTREDISTVNNSNSKLRASDSELVPSPQ